VGYVSGYDLVAFPSEALERRHLVTGPVAVFFHYLELKAVDIQGYQHIPHVVNASNSDVI
jgi:hypothetical protein